MLLLIIILLIAVVIFFYNFIKARKASVQAAERQKLLDENAVRAEEINNKLKEIWDDLGKIISYENRRKLEKERNILEKELYELTGQPTTLHYQARVATIAEDNWKKKHGLPTRRQIEAAKAEMASKEKAKQQPKIPWGLVGALGPDLAKKFMSEAAKTLLDEELRRKNRYL